jgi:hypothetical protein
MSSVRQVAANVLHDLLATVADQVFFDSLV